MYSTLLNRVVKVINETVGKSPSEKNGADDFYNLMFKPDVYKAQMEERQVREKRTNQLIVGATAIAAIGELYHIVKRSGMLNKNQ